MADSNKDEIVKKVSQEEGIEKEKRRIITRIQEDKSRRDQETSYFRNSNLMQYTEAGLGQFIGHRSKPEWKKDYQYNLFDPITRDKVYSIISKSSGLYEAQFFNTNKRLAKFSETITTILSAFYTDSARQLKEIDRNKMTMLSALVFPKAILYEGWRHQKRTIREITKRDDFGEPLEVKEKKIVHYNGPWSQLIPVEDIIPGSLRIRDLQEQPRFAWVEKMQKEEFDRLFPATRFPEAKKVQTYGVLFDNDFTEFTIRNDMKENEVEVVRDFEKWDDKTTIIANGVMITKLNSPMPFAHKEYPFIWGGFEELSPWFVYDMPLTIKLMDMQDMNNEILNLSLDMVWRALNEIILVKSGDGINDDTLYGGGMVDVDDPSNFQKLEFGSSFGFTSAQKMREVARQSIENASVDAMNSGQRGAPRTAREAVIAREAAIEIVTLFLQNMENMERDKAKLRVMNQLDRYKRPVDWKKIVGVDNTEQAVAMFRELNVRNTRLDGGKRGTAIIAITEKPRASKDLNKANVENDKEMSQTIDVSPEFIRDITFDVEIVGNSSVRKSKTQEIQESRAFLADANAMPDVLNRKSAARDYVKKMGKNEDEFLVTEEDPMAAMLSQGNSTPNGKKPPQMPTDEIEDALNMSF